MKVQIKKGDMEISAEGSAEEISDLILTLDKNPIAKMEENIKELLKEKNKRPFGPDLYPPYLRPDYYDVRKEFDKRRQDYLPWYEIICRNGTIDNMKFNTSETKYFVDVSGEGQAALEIGKCWPTPDDIQMGLS